MIKGLTGCANGRSHTPLTLCLKFRTLFAQKFYRFCLPDHKFAENFKNKYN